MCGPQRGESVGAVASSSLPVASMELRRAPAEEGQIATEREREREGEESMGGLLLSHERDLKRVQRNGSWRLGAEGSLEHDAAMLQQVADRTRKGFVKSTTGMRKVFAAGRVHGDGPVAYGAPGGGAPLADVAAQALRDMQEQMDRLRAARALASDAAGGRTPRVTDTVRTSILALDVEESPVSVVSSDEESFADTALPPPPPGGPSSTSDAGGLREQLLSSGLSPLSSAPDDGTQVAPAAALQEALAEHVRKLRSLKTALQRTAGQRSQLLYRPQPAVTALHYWLEHTGLCCSSYDALVRLDRATDMHLSLDHEAALLVDLQKTIQHLFAGLAEPSSGGDSDLPWSEERSADPKPPEAVPAVLRRRAPPFIRLPGPDEFCCALRARLPAGAAAAVMLGGIAASPRTPRGVLPPMPSRSAKRPPPSEPAFVELVQGFLRHHLGLLPQSLGQEHTAVGVRLTTKRRGSSTLAEVLERGFKLSAAQRQTLSAELCQRTISTTHLGEDSVADLERAVEAVDATWVDRLLGPPLGVKRAGAPHQHFLPCHSCSHTNLKSPCAEQATCSSATSTGCGRRGGWCCAAILHASGSCATTADILTRCQRSSLVSFMRSLSRSRSRSRSPGITRYRGIGLMLNRWGRWIWHWR